MQIRLRNPNGADDRNIGVLMYDAIHRGVSKYTHAQRRAWLPQPNEGENWTARLAAQQVFLAEDRQKLRGVMTLDEGYIDLAYVAADAQGQGVFRALYEMLEKAAVAQGHGRLWTHASLMAQPAFLAVGFHVIAHETVARAGQTLDRAEMEKTFQ